MKRSYILDTNLLVLLIVGKTSERFIGTHKRTASYTIDDLVLLEILLSDAEKIIVTPNILSETSNLVRNFSDPGRARILEFFKFFIENSCEIYSASAEAVQRSDFERLGLTDVAILAIQDDDFILLTDDLDLYLASKAMGKTTINFSHERERMLRG